MLQSIKMDLLSTNKHSAYGSGHEKNAARLDYILSENMSERWKFRDDGRKMNPLLINRV